MDNPTYFLKTKFHNFSMDETLEIVENTIKNGEKVHHSVINAGKVVSLQNNKELRDSVNEADLINIDGKGVEWAAKFLGHSVKERVAGIDLMQNLVKLSSEKDYKIFFFGAKEEIVTKVVDIYTKQYGKKILAGYRNGYFSDNEEASIAQEIAESKANILFVAISSPKKEIFLYNNRDVLEKVNFVMGVGGSFDVVAGKVKRAPLWMQRVGLEWFYRFIQEPKRMWRRYLIGNAKFILLVIKERFK